MTKRVAVLGCGYWGKNHVRNFAKLGALAAVCDPTEAGRRLASELAPTAAVHEDPAAVLADPTIDGVVVATPAVTHADLVERALAAGKDVLCEKPLALDADVAARLALRARELDRVLMVGHILEYHAAFAKLRELVDSGELGAVRLVISHRLSLGKVRTEENVLWSFAPHDIAMTLRLVDGTPERIAAWGTAVRESGRAGESGRADPELVHDAVSARIEFSDGAVGQVFVSWTHPFKEQRLVVIGTRRMAVFDDVAKRLVVHDKRIDHSGEIPEIVRGEEREIEFEDTEPLREECSDFLRAITTRETPRADAASAVEVLRVLQAAQESIERRGEPVDCETR